MSPRPELRALTGARGIAAWFVVLFHLRYLWRDGGGPDGPLSYGFLAVDFFFVLSGFVIALTYADRLRAEGIAGIPEFLRRRIARVWPLHLVCLAGAVVFALLIATLGKPDWGQYPPAELPLHLLLLQNWGLTDRLTWNVPAWSISCELAAYIIFPWLSFAIDWRKLPTPVLILAMIAFALALHAIFMAAGATDIGDVIERFGVVRCLAEFAIGTIACALWLRWRDKPLAPALAATATGAMLIGLCLTRILPDTIALPLAFAALVLLLALTSGMRGNLLESGPVHYLGEISYATYLGHWMLWMGFKLAFVPKEGMGLGLFALFAAMTLALSVLLYHGIERPAQKWVNGLKLPRLRPIPPPALPPAPR
jgi:peptidoglycan/LPS O-acetylase OafA/YrhL